MNRILMLHGLSKSRLLSFRQCPKRLWLHVHRREFEEFAEPARMAFQRGFGVGEAARSLSPDGLLIDTENPSEALAETRRVLEARSDRPIFEAAFAHDGVLVRIDLLVPEAGAYRMTEVKASTRVKDYHLTDGAVQAWVCAQAGIPLTRVELAHVDTGFVYPGGGDYRGLLHPVDLTDELPALIAEVPAWVGQARRVLDGDEPSIGPGPHCSDPFDCPFLAYCTRDLPIPEEVPFPVETLPRGGSLAAELREEGYCDLREVPSYRLTKPRHQRMQRVALNGQAELDPEAAVLMQVHPYPRYYLDFESIQFAVPIWAGTRPYEQLVFQWSCHVETTPGDLRHLEFLDASGDDPRRPFAAALITALEREGPIFVYNRAFEGSCLRRLAAALPDLAVALHTIDARLIDLLPIARNHYYHPDMHGSWSIKAVLPTVAPDLDYSKLEVQHGAMAQEAYLELIQPDLLAERRRPLRQSLLDYCQRDTLALVRLAWYFEGRV